MAPHLAAAGIGAHRPIRVVDHQALPAELDVEAGWRLYVERQHRIIAVLAERVDDIDPCVHGAVIGASDVFERLCLDHEVVEPWSTGDREVDVREAVMPRRRAHEDGAVGAPRELVGHPEAHHSTEEVERVVARRHHVERMAEADAIGDET